MFDEICKKRFVQGYIMGRIILHVDDTEMICIIYEGCFRERMKKNDADMYGEISMEKGLPLPHS